MRSRYQGLVQRDEHPEDVRFRRDMATMPAERILEVLEQELGVPKRDMLRRRRGVIARPLASKMLCKYGGLTQREVGSMLGLKSGTGVSLQLRKLAQLAATDPSVTRMLTKLEKRLRAECRRRVGQGA